jgi:hypothetical protein
MTKREKYTDGLVKIDNMLGDRKKFDWRKPLEQTPGNSVRKVFSEIDN